MLRASRKGGHINVYIPTTVIGPCCSSQNNFQVLSLASYASRLDNLLRGGNVLCLRCLHRLEPTGASEFGIVVLEPDNNISHFSSFTTML